MVGFPLSRLRNIAACALLLSGIAYITLLWFREISATGLITAGVGATYLIAALGLFGTSRLSLLAGLCLPAIGCWYMLNYDQSGPIWLVYGQCAIAALVIYLTTVALFVGTYNGSKPESTDPTATQ